MWGRDVLPLLLGQPGRAPDCRLMACFLLLDHFGRQNGQLDPLFNQVACPRIPLPTCIPVNALELAELKEVKLVSKGDKVGKETVEVPFTAEVDEVVELGVVDVCKDTEELLVDVLCRCEKGDGKFARCWQVWT